MTTLLYLYAEVVATGKTEQPKSSLMIMVTKEINLDGDEGL